LPIGIIAVIVVKKNPKTLKRSDPRHIEAHQKIRVDVPVLLFNGLKVCRQEGPKEDRMRQQTKSVGSPKRG
jgi:hypothetical protein